MRICILGSGSWGTTLGQVLVDNNHEVILYGIDKGIDEDININHRNSKYFGSDVILPSALKATLNLEEALHGSDVIIFAIPTSGIKELAKKVSKFFNTTGNNSNNKDKKVYIVNVSKGFDPETDKRISVILREVLPKEKIHPIVSLIGPSHAEEVIVRMLTCITSTSKDLETAEVIQKLFANNYFRVYTNTDEKGAEYAAAIKNTIAIAAGALVGLGYGDNVKAALVTRGLAEITRFGKALNCKKETFYGLTGVGDLMVTCNSVHSRNFMAGYEIGKSRNPEQFIKNNTKTVEGIRTAKVLHTLAVTKHIDMPICEAVYQVLYNNKDIDLVINELMTRSLKNE